MAIPAIGTGNLKIPAGIVARIMYEEAEEFSRANPMTALNDVRFVVYDKDQPTISVSGRRSLSRLSSCVCMCVGGCVCVGVCACVLFSILSLSLIVIFRCCQAACSACSCTPDV